METPKTTLNIFSPMILICELFKQVRRTKILSKILIQSHSYEIVNCLFSLYRKFSAVVLMLRDILLNIHLPQFGQEIQDRS